MAPVVCLHDLRASVEGLVGANLGNADLLSDAEAFLEAHPGALITADDGYRSVLDLLPAVERTGARFRVFLTTGILDRRYYPYELALSDAMEGRDTYRVFGRSLPPDLAFREAHARMKPETAARRAQLLSEILAENGQQAPEFEETRFLTWAEAADLARHPQVEIGAHGDLHLHLPSLSPAGQFREIARPRRLLARRLGVAVACVAYPYGGNRSLTRALARVAGYRVGYGTTSGPEGPMNRRRVALATALSRPT